MSYDQVLQQEIDKILKGFSANTLEAAPRTLQKTEGGKTYTTEKPFQGRVEDGGQMAVVSGSESQSTAIAPQSRQQIVPSDQPVTQGTSLQTPVSLGQADQKLRIQKLDMYRLNIQEWEVDGPESSSRLLVKDDQGHGVDPGTISPAVRKMYGLAVRTYTIKSEPRIRKHMFGNGALNIPKIPESVKLLKLIRKLQHHLHRTKELGCLTDANEVPLDGQREDEDSYDALASLLDFYRDLDPPKTPAASGRSKNSVSRARFVPESSLLRRAATTMSGRHALDRQSPGSSKRLYSTSTIPKRHNATATVSKED